MNDTDKAAYIQSQVACALIVALGMFSENMQRNAEGNSMSFTCEDFIKLIYDYNIGHNDVISYLRD